ncbi:MAG: hypothetical protein IJA72_01330 [Clostridia bacterium]|nr:hypothetical protein [Clostridia bacterium]
MNNISSKFNYTTELGVQATKQTFKLKKTRKDIIVNVLMVVFIAVMIGVVIYDIVRDASITIDLIILIALVGVEIFNLVMPFVIIHMQKKFLKQLNLTEIDYTITEIKNGKCIESYYKNNKVSMQNVCDVSKLVAYTVKDNYVFAVFSNFACAIFDINTLTMPLEEFKEYLDKTISKNKLTKSNKS